VPVTRAVNSPVKSIVSVVSEVGKRPEYNPNTAISNTLNVANKAQITYEDTSFFSIISDPPFFEF
jgi:hypothetical protein